MKVAILAGGLGTRLSESSESIPKPMVVIGSKPILWHIMQTFSHFGHNDFLLALGYKAEMVKDFFLRYSVLNSNFIVNLQSGEKTQIEGDNPDWNVTLVDTGVDTMTGGRVKRMQPFIGNETVFLTYGDGLADIDVDQLLKFHRGHGKLATITAVRPTARFGELTLKGDEVTEFEEKPQTREGWINGGYFVLEPEFFDLIADDDSTVLEIEPLERAAKLGQLMAYKHHGFWQCMDTPRDRTELIRLWDSGARPWQRE